MVVVVVVPPAGGHSLPVLPGFGHCPSVRCPWYRFTCSYMSTPYEQLPGDSIRQVSNASTQSSISHMCSKFLYLRLRQSFVRWYCTDLLKSIWEFRFQLLMLLTKWLPHCRSLYDPSGRTPGRMFDKNVGLIFTIHRAENGIVL